MRLARGALLLLWIAASAGFAGAQQAEAPEPAPPPIPVLDPPALVAEQIASIESLAVGDPSPDLDLSALFGVDPLDGGSLPARLAALDEAAEGWRAERRRVLGTPADDWAGDDDSAADLSLHGRPLLAPSDALRLAQLDLLIQRDEARLAFLSADEGVRADAVQAVDDARRLRAEREAAEAARLEAEENARLAEEARLEALERAKEARSLAAAELASEEARVEEVRRALAEQQSAYADGQLQRAEATLRRVDVADRIEAAGGGGHLGAAQADRLYDAAVDALAEARAALGAALSEQRADTRYPAFEPSLDPGGADYAELTSERDRLLSAVDALTEERGAALADESALRWAAVDALAIEVLRLNDARLALLPLLGDAKREAVLGIGPEGLGQLAREANHLKLVSAWYVQARLRSLGEAPGWAFRVLGRASGRWNLTLLLVVLLGTLQLVRQRHLLFNRLDEFVRESIDDDEFEQRALQWTGWARAIAVPVTRLIAFWIAAGLAFRLLPTAEVALIGRVAITYAGYRALQAFLHHFLIRASAITRHRVSADASERLRRSIQLMLRYALLVVIFLEVAAAVLGKGYLYTLVQDFAWLGAIPIALILLRRWRDEVFDAFAASFPRSRLLAPINSARGRLFAPVAILPAAALLAARAVWVYVRSTALRFERTRRALAYLFRRRLQTQAETLGHGTHDIDALPDDLRDVFRRPPDDALKVSHFPGLDDTVSRIVRYTGGDAGCAIALVGQRGVGKTAWLEELKGRLPSAPVVTGSLDRAADSPEAVFGWLCELLELPACEDVDQMVEAIKGAPARVILLDRCQNLALRAVRGMEGYRALMAVMRRTSSHVCWICSFSRFIWEYLEFATRGQDLFHRVVVLPGWPEDAIRQLIEKRMDDCGVDCSFDDLVDDDVHPLERAEARLRTRERFMRLLWDYTDGIPRLAMYFWLRSLVPDAAGTLRVRPFDGPGPDDLEHLGEKARFVLNAVVSHEDLTVDEAVQVLQYRPDSCLAVLEQLRARGYLTLDGDRYRSTHHWDRAAVRYLRRKHLLYL